MLVEAFSNGLQLGSQLMLGIFARGRCLEWCTHYRPVRGVSPSESVELSHAKAA